MISLRQTSTIPCFSTVTRCLLSPHAWKKRKSWKKVILFALLGRHNSASPPLMWEKPPNNKNENGKGIFSFPLIVQTLVRRGAKNWDWSQDWRSRGQMTAASRFSNKSSSTLLHAKPQSFWEGGGGRFKPLKIHQQGQLGTLPSDHQNDGMILFLHLSYIGKGTHSFGHSAVQFY